MDEGIDTTEDTATRRQVQPNATLDQEGVQSDNLFRFRRSRRAMKDSITKKIDEINLRLSQASSVEAISSKAHEFQRIVESFRTAHATYDALLSNEDDIEDSQDYYETECRRIDAFQVMLDEWLANAVRMSHESADNDIHPEDSVSNVGSRSRAHPPSSLAAMRKSLGGSTVYHAQSPRTAAAAKRAALAAEAAALHKQRALQEEELRLKQEAVRQQQQREESRLRLDQRKRQLDLETEIAKAEAEE